uniref:Uncharacterized protein n=1 Tax=Cacopsylla melanoneura TaxID=428564 RepID=A0A8D9ESM7_9HEMI
MPEVVGSIPDRGVLFSGGKPPSRTTSSLFSMSFILSSLSGTTSCCKLEVSVLFINPLEKITKKMISSFISIYLIFISRVPTKLYIFYIILAVSILICWVVYN